MNEILRPDPTVQSSAVVKPISILFGGDVMFDRYIRTVTKQKGQGFVLRDVAELLMQNDMVVVNLEGPITEQSSVSETSLEGEAKNYVFTFAPDSVQQLQQSHIGIVNIGNNHILNFGTDGVQSTKKFLTAGGVEFFGSPLPHDERILMKRIRDTSIALVNYNQFVTDGRERALQDIVTARERGADVIVLYAHWGVEYKPVTDSVRDVTHQFVEAGVDLIIGSHPHVVQEKEVYQGKTIYYSLGNMVFDQYFRPETTQGLLVRATLDPRAHDFSLQEIPILLKNTGQTVLAEEE